MQFQRDQTIVFEGDSLTALRKGGTLDQWPWLRISNNHRSWADTFSELLFAWYPEWRLNFRTAAVAGSTCRGVMARLEEIVAPLRPDWVFLTLGSNDAVQQIPLAEFEGSLSRYAVRLAEWGGQLVILYNFKAGPNAGEAAFRKEPLREPYYAIEVQLAETHPNVHLLDVGTPLLEKAKAHYEKFPGHSIYSDATHFSNLGGMIIAGEVLKAFGIVRR